MASTEAGTSTDAMSEGRRGWERQQQAFLKCLTPDRPTDLPGPVSAAGSRGGRHRVIAAVIGCVRLCSALCDTVRHCCSPHFVAVPPLCAGSDALCCRASDASAPQHPPRGERRGSSAVPSCTHAAGGCETTGTRRRCAILWRGDTLAFLVLASHCCSVVQAWDTHGRCAYASAERVRQWRMENTAAGDKRCSERACRSCHFQLVSAAAAATIGLQRAHHRRFLVVCPALQHVHCSLFLLLVAHRRSILASLSDRQCILAFRRTLPLAAL